MICARGNHGLRLSLLVLCLGKIAPATAASTAWLQEQFPNRWRDIESCHTDGSGRLCDPDGILSREGLERLETFLQTKTYIEATSECQIQGVTFDNTTDADVLELQIGVALVQKMDLNPFGGEGYEDLAAETFSQYLHDQWGVGVDIESCGGSGILLFLSIGDRKVSVSRGAALEGTLTDQRIDQVIEDMKDLLQSEEYDSAILQALQDMQQYIQEGPPPLWEEYNSYALMYVLLAIFLVLLVFTIEGWEVNSCATKEYARVQSQLSEVDRAQAEALQEHFKCTSCPICLEDFEPPITDHERATQGSDGQPIKLLRCGHCLDQTCWAEWISSGRGNITKCPVCMQSIAGTTDNSKQGDTHEQQQQHEQEPQRPAGHEDDYNIDLANFDSDSDSDDDNWNHEQERSMLRWRSELNSRLERARWETNRYLVNQQEADPSSYRPADGAEKEGQPRHHQDFARSNPTFTSPATGGHEGVQIGGFGGSRSSGARVGGW